MFKITYMTRGFQTMVVDLEVSTEYEARKSVASLPDYDMVIRCDQRHSLTGQRQTAAQEAYVSYNFGDGVFVEDCSGWEHITTGNSWTRPVYVRTDEGLATDTSTRLNFSVLFEESTAQIVEAWATDGKGALWGKAKASSFG